MKQNNRTELLGYSMFETYAKNRPTYPPDPKLIICPIYPIEPLWSPPLYRSCSVAILDIFLAPATWKHQASELLDTQGTSMGWVFLGSLLILPAANASPIFHTSSCQLITRRCCVHQRKRNTQKIQNEHSLWFEKSLMEVMWKSSLKHPANTSDQISQDLEIGNLEIIGNYRKTEGTLWFFLFFFWCVGYFLIT